MWLTLEKVAEMPGKKINLVNLVWHLGQDQTSHNTLLQAHFPNALMLTLWVVFTLSENPRIHTEIDFRCYLSKSALTTNTHVKLSSWVNLTYGTIMRTGITCKKIPFYMGDSACRWFIVKKAKIF